LYQEHEKDVKNPCLNEDTELQELIVSTLRMKAGFTLTDPKDHRYQVVSEHRTRFGNILRNAASALRHNSEGEDHIDAVIIVTKAIDVFLLDHGGITRSTFDAVQKKYAHARESVSFYDIFPGNSFLAFQIKSDVVEAEK
jgi:proteasome activator subunit 4